MSTLPLPTDIATNTSFCTGGGFRPRARQVLEVEIASYLGDLHAAERLFADPANFHAKFAEDDLADLARLAVLVDERDDATGKHAVRVGVLARQFSLHVGFPPGAGPAIELAARLHDIGKIFIPDHILLKPSSLTPAERQSMQQHTSLGAQMLSNSSRPGRLLARLMSHFHHENWDARGYPYGLPGERIPCIVRLVSVVDVFDALINERPYKQAWDAASALHWMLGHAGRQFDPKLVRQFADFMSPAKDDLPGLRRRLEEDALELAC